MDFSLESIEKHIPYYLAGKAKVALEEAFKSFPENIKYYSTTSEDLLQGDGCSSFQIVDIETFDRRRIKGIILSNSCDIAPNNQRDFSPKICFAPIIRLSRYIKLLKQNGIDNEKAQSKIDAIKSQKITTMFFLPAEDTLEEDYIAILDDVHNVPSNIFFEAPDRQRLFSLSQVGFYLFIFKLSIHFCRLHEEVKRPC